MFGGQLPLGIEYCGPLTQYRFGAFSPVGLVAKAIYTAFVTDINSPLSLNAERELSL